MERTRCPRCHLDALRHRHLAGSGTIDLVCTSCEAVLGRTPIREATEGSRRVREDLIISEPKGAMT